MKNKILIAVLAVVAVLGGAYYYIYILNTQGKIPVQIRTSINKLIGKKETPPPLPVKPPVPKPAPVPAVQTQMTSVKKSVQQPVAATAVQKPVSSVKKADKQSPEVKPEQQKPVDARTSVSAGKKKEKPAEVKKTKKTKKTRKSAKKKAIQSRNYKVEYAAETEDEANKIKDELIAKGYHTAQTSERGGKHYVIIMPFTDTWEAEFIQQNVEKDTGRRGFCVRTIR